MNERIREARKYRGITQKELADQVMLSRNFINQIECGKLEASERTIHSIAEVLRVSEEWLITGNGDMIPRKSMEEEIARIAKELHDSDQDDVKYKIIMNLVKMSEEDVKRIKNLVSSMIGN